MSEITDRLSQSISKHIEQFMLLLPPSVAKHEPESTKPSSSDLSDKIDLYEDDLPASAALDRELHCWVVKWRRKIEEVKCYDSP